jgi:hypothetical protein
MSRPSSAPPVPDEFVLVPRVGFRLARGGLKSGNVVVRQGDQTLTAELTSDRDGADISMKIEGVPEELPFRQSRPVEAPVSVVDERGQHVTERPPRYVVSSHLCRLMEGPTFFQRMVTLERLDPAVRSVEVTMTGGAGDWRFLLPVEPTNATGVPGVPTTARAVVHDIEITVPLLARTAALTAVELETYDQRRPESIGIDQAERWIEGIGSPDHHRGLGQDLLMLRDSSGAHHLERPPAISEQAPRARRREVALFGPVSEDAVSASLEIPYVAVRERSDELRVPVPGDTKITLNGCRARALTSRVDRSSDSVPGHPSPIAGLNGPCVRMVLSPIGDGERQLVMVGVMESNDRGMTVSRARAEAPVIELPDPTGDASFLTLKNPVIRMQGPWQLEFELPR